MSTATLTRPARVNTAPKLAQAMPGENHCEECGRHVAIVLCKKCREITDTRIGDQLWGCRECGTLRAWGLMHPADPTIRPAIGCAPCDAVTRHEFVGVKHSR